MSGRRVTAIIGVLALATLGTARLAQATPLALDGTWVVLDDDAVPHGATHFFFTGFGLAGGSATLAGATAYTWTSADTVEFDITDLFVVGDAFNVYDNGLLVANVSGKGDWTTIGGACTPSFADQAPCHYADTPDIAWADPLFNQASLFFGPGSHAIKIEDIHIPARPAGGVLVDGTVAFRAEAVPEPVSLLLVGSGLLGFAARRRLSKRS